jgi:hypothetical protein
VTTHWSDHGPEGWRNAPFSVEDVSDEFCPPGSDEAALLVTAWPSLPDWVRQPAELGGRQLRVLRQGRLAAGLARCLNCGDTAEKDALELEDGYGVAMCGACRQYSWFRRRGAGGEQSRGEGRRSEDSNGGDKP